MSFLLLIFFVPQFARAWSISAGLGLGDTMMKNEANESEGPMTETFTIENLVHSRLAVGAEHLRSLTTKLDSSASFTGFLGRYYLNAAPMPLVDVDKLSSDSIALHDVAVFIGTGLGLAQSSRLPNSSGLSSNAEGVYLSPRAGVDYQMDTSIGIRGEFLYGTTLFGTGNVSTISLGASLYWIFK